MDSIQKRTHLAITSRRASPNPSWWMARRFWQKEQTFAIEKVLDTPAPKDVPLGVYFHIPFCRKRCTFCYFHHFFSCRLASILRFHTLKLLSSNN